MGLVGVCEQCAWRYCGVPSEQCRREGIERRREQEANDRRRRQVEARAARAIAEAHPEEFEVEREAQEVFVALEEGFKHVPLPPAVRRVMESA